MAQKKKDKYRYYVGQRGLRDAVEVFCTDVPPNFVKVSHQEYRGIVGPFPSREWADRAADAPWKAEEILAESRAAGAAGGGGKKARRR